jgi:putative addiction module component (TIGR02574 family)
MNTTVEQIRSQAMDLSASERASLAHDLILSLDDASDLYLGVEQEQEIERRVRMVREGKATGRPANVVFADLKAKYR